MVIQYDLEKIMDGLSTEVVSRYIRDEQKGDHVSGYVQNMIIEPHPDKEEFVSDLMMIRSQIEVFNSKGYECYICYAITVGLRDRFISKMTACRLYGALMYFSYSFHKHFGQIRLGVWPPRDCSSRLDFLDALIDKIENGKVL